MDIPLGDTYYLKFTTRQFSTGAPFTLAGTPAISVYEENNLTQITAGITLTADYDSVTGLNDVAIVATTGNGYEAGKYYNVVITTGTVDSVSVVGEVVGHFRMKAAETAAGIPAVDVTHAGGSAASASSGVLAVNTTQIEGVDATNQINAECDTAISDAALATASNLATVDTNVDSILLQTGTNGVVLATDAVSAAALSAAAVTEIVNGLRDLVIEDDGPASDASIRFADALAYMLAVCAGVASGQGTSSGTFLSPGGNENRVQATTDTDGNRSAITLTPPS